MLMSVEPKCMGRIMTLPVPSRLRKESMSYSASLRVSTDLHGAVYLNHLEISLNLRHGKERKTNLDKFQNISWTLECIHTEKPASLSQCLDEMNKGTGCGCWTDNPIGFILPPWSNSENSVGKGVRYTDIKLANYYAFYPSCCAGAIFIAFLWYYVHFLSLLGSVSRV